MEEFIIASRDDLEVGDQVFIKRADDPFEEINQPAVVTREATYDEYIRQIDLSNQPSFKYTEDYMRSLGFSFWAVTTD